MTNRIGGTRISARPKPRALLILTARYIAIRYKAPWAKLTTPKVPKIRVRPRAMSTYMEPSCKPVNKDRVKALSVISILEILPLVAVAKSWYFF
jgi:hypothetical protein|tara:strand:- start:194 stop:475 length:282 start_codon:yes stop_codon:yes gene_type:complete